MCLNHQKFAFAFFLFKLFMFSFHLILLAHAFPSIGFDSASGAFGVRRVRRPACSASGVFGVRRQKNLKHFCLRFLLSIDGQNYLSSQSVPPGFMMPFGSKWFLSAFKIAIFSSPSDFALYGANNLPIP